jgi:hypothetical protein
MQQVVFYISDKIAVDGCHHRMERFACRYWERGLVQVRLFLKCHYLSIIDMVICRMDCWQIHAASGWLNDRCARGEEFIQGFQVLISIQSMILCDEPYLNEPGWASSGGTPQSKACMSIFSFSHLSDSASELSHCRRFCQCATYGRQNCGTSKLKSNLLVFHVG